MGPVFPIFGLCARLSHMCQRRCPLLDLAWLMHSAAWRPNFCLFGTPHEYFISSVFQYFCGKRHVLRNFSFMISKFMRLQAGGPYYQVKQGRWDGRISMASRVSSNIPRANSTVDQLLKLFGSKGLTQEDLVVLSGAHTIGFAHCQNFLSRLYDYRGTKQPDPAIDPRLLKALRMSCPKNGGNIDIVEPFDVTTPFLFDQAYYSNLAAKLGLLASDQALFSDPRTKPLVQGLANDKNKFFQAFAAAMEKMGSIGVKRGRKHGEKRKDCSVHMS